MRRQFGVIGLGRFGSNVAKRLEHLGFPVLAIDKNEVAVEEVKDYVTIATVLDASLPQMLESAGIKSCDTVVVAIGSDIQASILTCIILKELGIKHIVAKANNEVHGRVLEKIGVNEIIYPERDMGVRLANRLSFSNILDFIDISPEYNITEFKINRSIIGKTLKQLNLIESFRLNVLGIKRQDEFIINFPSSEELKEDDVLVMLGKVDNTNEFIEKYAG